MEGGPVQHLQPVDGLVYHELSGLNRAFLGEATDCSICMSEFRLGTLTASTQCNHHYHYTCLMKELTRRSEGVI